MKKTLVLYARICPGESQHTRRIFEMYEKLDGITAVKLDGHQPFDPIKEQEFIKQFDNVILLFTINWYNIPWNLSRYFAEVWRFGDFNLEGVNIRNVVTCGGSEEAYKERWHGANAEEFLNNVNGVFKRLKTIRGEDRFYYGAAKYDEERLERFIKELRTEYLEKIQNN